jgi:hypothetical protein
MKRIVTWRSGCTLAMLLLSGVAQAECKDILLNLSDTSGKLESGRALTMFLNCHEGSYQFPAATTVHTFEWREGRICHQWKSCGNTRYWSGHFGVGAIWTWGNSFTDFLSKTRVKNDLLVVPGQPGGRGGDVNSSQVANKACVNVKHGDSVIYDSNSQSNFNLQHADQDLYCANLASLSSTQIQAIVNRASATGFKAYGYGEQGYRPLCYGGSGSGGAGGSGGGGAGGSNTRSCASSPGSTNFGSCTAGSGSGGDGGDGGDGAGGGCYFTGLNYFAPNNTNVATNYQDVKQICVNKAAIGQGNSNYQSIFDGGTNVGDIFFPACKYDNNGNVLVARGGDGGDAAPAVIGNRGSHSRTDGEVDTTYDETNLSVDFAFDFGDIKRYCKDISEMDCW